MYKTQTLLQHYTAENCQCNLGDFTMYRKSVTVFSQFNVKLRCIDK